MGDGECGGGSLSPGCKSARSSRIHARRGARPAREERVPYAARFDDRRKKEGGSAAAVAAAAAAPFQLPCPPPAPVWRHTRVTRLSVQNWECPKWTLEFA